MSKRPTRPASTTVSPNLLAILRAIPSQLPKRESAGPMVTVTREDAAEAVAAVEALLEAVQHEGSMQAISAGGKVEHWHSQITASLRQAYDGVVGQRTVTAH